MDTWICGYLVTKGILRFVVTEYLCFCVSAYPPIFRGCFKMQGIQQFSLLLSGGSRERPPVPSFFKTKLRPKGPKKIVFETGLPPLTEGLDVPLLFNAIHVSNETMMATYNR